VCGGEHHSESCSGGFLLQLWGSEERIGDVPGGVHNHAQGLGLESFQDFNVGGGSSAPELYVVGPDK
jgi:hypothetical protein